MSSKYLIVYHLTIEKNLWGKTRIQLQVIELFLGHAADVPKGLEVNAINERTQCT